jgi:AcrR family transcriptional regulator
MVVRPSTKRGAATRARILEVATAEFTAHGLAGARIDRIVAAARTNKAQLYGYFGGKDGLFDAVFDESVRLLTETVPFDAEDLPGWAAGLYDEYLRRPANVRLATWARLERNRPGLLTEGFAEVDAVKTAAIVRAQEAGLLRAGEPHDLLSMVIAMSLTWSPVSPLFAASVEEGEETHERRRALLRECVGAAVLRRQE